MLFRTTSVLALTLLFFGCDGGGGAAGTPIASSGGGSPSASGASSEDIGDVLASVNGMPIGSKEFEQAAARKSPESGDTLSSAEKTEVLDRLVEERLLYEAALKKGLDKDPKVQKVMVNTLLREVVYANIRNSDFSDEELQKYYEANKDDFIVPEKVQISRILIKVTEDRPDAEAQAEAGRIRSQIADSASFKDLAAKFSEDPYRRRGGDVGFVPRSGKPGLDQAIVDKAFEMDVNVTSEVFKTDEGYNLIQVANKRERVERTFQQMKGSVLRKVKNDKLKELYDEYVGGLRQGAELKINTETLDALEIKTVRRPMGPGFALDPGSLDLEPPDGFEPPMGMEPDMGEDEGLLEEE